MSKSFVLFVALIAMHFYVDALAQRSVDLKVQTLVDGALVETNRTFRVDSLHLTVPENRTETTSRSIDLPFVRIRATADESAEPVFWLGGGPGQTNLRTFDYDHFIGRHDHVMVGYRGVDGSSSLDCGEVTDVLKDADDILEDESLERIRFAFEACWVRLTRAGVDIDSYTILDVVHDLEAARVALGYGRINIVAESFGTRLGYLYALRYPENVHRMILVGAQPPGGMIWDPYQQDDLVREYGRLWDRDPSAIARHPDLVEAVRSVNQNMPRSWLFMPIHPGTVKASAHPMLFQSESAAKVFDTYVAAANGDASGLWLISFVAGFVIPDVVNWGENASKAVSADYEPGRDLRHELLPDDAVFGAPLGSFLWAPTEGWPIRRLPDAYRMPDTSFVQTLAISGNLDLTTPANNVTEGLMPYLPNGTHVVLAEMGHVVDLWQENPAGTHRLVTTFLESGAIDSSLVRYVPMDFEVSWGFPLLAKLLVAGVLLTVLLLIAVIWIVVRIVRRRFRVPV